MTEYYKNPNEELDFFRFDDDGKIYELDIVYGQWEDVTEYETFSTDWEEVSIEYIDSFRLFIYVEQSDKYFQVHKKEVGIDEYKYGDDFDFYITDDGVIAIDNNKEAYLCNPKIMVPRMKKITEIKEDWYKLPLEQAIDYIENQNGIFLSDMELYYDQNGDIQGFTTDLRQFTLSLKNGELNEVYEDIGIDPEWKECYISDPVFDNENIEIVLSVKQYEKLKPLYDYKKKSENEYNKTKHRKPFGKIFSYYQNQFGKIFAKDENNIIYECNSDFMKITKEKKDVNDCYQIERFYVLDSIKEYEEHTKELRTKEITLRDLFLLENKDHQVIGITEDGRKYYLSLETGDLVQTDKLPELNDQWKIITKKDGLIIQSLIKKI